MPLVTLSGGVSCNRALRAQMESACERARLQFIAAPPALSTDNAAMIAFAAALRFASGAMSNVSDEIDPNLALV
jgi:N6-L-threonylcarbamoyladenine synthase